MTDRGWVVDTCVLVDVLEDDPDFGATSAAELDCRLADGLVVCPVTYAELAPAFDGDRALQDEFLTGIGISRTEWAWEDTTAAHAAWARHIAEKRRGNEVRRPIADVLIGAYATRHRGLITRNDADFRGTFPDLEISNPEGPAPDEKAKR